MISENNDYGTCVVLAGGEGRRVRSLTNNRVPKPMLPIAGRPFIEHKLKSLKSMGFTTVHLLLGHQAEVITDFVETLSIPSLSIHTYLDGPELLGTGGSIKNQLPDLPNTFWVTYADSITFVDLRQYQTAKIDTAWGIMTVLDNSEGVEPSNVSLSRDRTLVTKYEKNATNQDLQWIDFGLLRLSAHHFSGVHDKCFDLSVVLGSLIDKQRLCALITSSRYFDIGTEATYLKTEALATTRNQEEWWT